MTDGDFFQLARRTLGSIRLLAGVGTDTVIELGDKARWRRFAPGDVLIRSGERYTRLFALVEGETRLFFDDDRADILSDAGATLGLRIAFDGGPSWATIRALTPAHVAEIARDDLIAAMTRSPALAANVGRMLASRNGRTEPRERLDAQIVKALHQLVGVDAGRSGTAELREPINPAVWATLLGVDRTDVERALIRLQRDLVLRTSKTGTPVVDLALLHARLD